MLHCQLCYAAVRIKNCLKRTFAIKVATMKITDDFCYKWKPSCAYHIIDTFVESKNNWDTKEGTGKPIACTVAWQKAPLRLK